MKNHIDGKAVHLAGLRFRGDRPTFDFMNEWSHCPEVERHSDRMSGAWVFRGTRVPVRGKSLLVEGSWFLATLNWELGTGNWEPTAG